MPDSPAQKRPLWKRLLISMLRIILIVTVLLLIVWIYIAQPTYSKNERTTQRIDLKNLQTHVEALSQRFHPRNHENFEHLDQAAEYIRGHFAKAGAETRYQEFQVYGKTYRNVIGVFGKGRGGKMVVGAHYDSCDDTPGADDNASGVAGLLELARLIGESDLDRELELAAYTLEEPPHFASSDMGSYLHAKRLAESGDPVEGVIVFEMIGYFTDQPGSQQYPMRVLKLLYPAKGNFIAVVGNLDQRAFTKRVKAGMKGATDLPVYSLNAPNRLPGVDFSDHRNYWPHGVNAVMITDTAFYRNDEYHQAGDTADRLDYERMGKVVLSTFAMLQSWNASSF